MPFVELETSLPAARLPGDLPAKLCAEVATILGKPEEDPHSLLPAGAVADRQEGHRHDFPVRQRSPAPAPAPTRAAACASAARLSLPGPACFCGGLPKPAPAPGA
ncbi:uncharacterized protein LOC123030293 isoform X2 [Varanus komodoensis]|uniref:uncharacterized protein LOC123030293 isoform X2 n=1 Tax=Varanus komodoensis TaxID=61221 RepID=UPI001CF7817D|nr:uncharacterized protein LOC123030293 isoform X2 [Varanus komodoensis]